MKTYSDYRLSAAAILWLGTALLARASVIQFSATAYKVNESDAQAVLRLERSGEVGSAESVDYTTTNGTAVGQLDYLPVAGSIAFAPGETNKLLLIPMLEDRIAECTETFRAILSNPSGGAILGTRVTATVSIVRNDWGRFFVEPPELTGSMLKLSWSGSADRWLEQSSSMKGATWQEVPGSRAQTNLVLPLSDGPSFFRAAGTAPPIKLTVLADNYRYATNTTAEWGFACLIEGTSQSILFDGGASTSTLNNNARNLGLGFCCLDLLVLSHDHWDHTGGLPLVLGTNHDLHAYLPFSTSASTRQIVEGSGATVHYEQQPSTICSNVWLTGEMPGDLINEQSLILDTPQGLVIVTGCAHQGITNILSTARQITGKNIFMVLGGFHLFNKTEAQIQPIIAEFQRQGVTKCGASHCTGDLAIRLFQQAYGTNYQAMGTGRVIDIPARDP